MGGEIKVKEGLKVTETPAGCQVSLVGDTLNPCRSPPGVSGCGASLRGFPKPTSWHYSHHLCPSQIRFIVV